MPTYDLSGAAKVLDATDKALTRIRGNMTGKIPASGREVYNAIDKRISAGRSVIDRAIRQAAEVENDARIYPDGKIKLIRQILDKAESEIRDHVESALALGDVLKADLTVAALPKMSGGREAATLARQDALMILDRAGKDRLDTVLRNLARRGDDVGALVHSGWLNDYLTAVGSDRTASAMRTLVQEEGLSAARTSGDPDRAKPAEAVQHAGQLAAASTGVQVAWRHVAEELSGARAAARLHELDMRRREARPDLGPDPVPDAA